MRGLAGTLKTVDSEDVLLSESTEEDGDDTDIAVVGESCEAEDEEDCVVSSTSMRESTLMMPFFLAVVFADGTPVFLPLPSPLPPPP